MAHRQLVHEPAPNAAIFSPSVARIAASTARDWSYIDAWLVSKFPGRSPPTLERNPDTLKALLALAALNDAADEDRLLLARADAAALRDLRHAAGQAASDHQLNGPLLDAIEHDLPRDGTAALQSMATMAVCAGLACPEPSHLGRDMVDLQASIFETERIKARVDVLHGHIQHEASLVSGLLQSLQGDSYKPPPHLARQNLDVQRKVKALSTQLPELADRVAALAASVDSSHPTVHDVALEEQQYLDILARKKDLDAQMAAFHGLPSDPDMARAELDSLRRQLQGVTSRRDAVFEGLVERESPVKRR